MRIGLDNIFRQLFVVHTKPTTLTMRYFYLLLFLLTSTTLLQAQQITVLDSKTKDPIPAANLYFYKDSKNILATSTDNLGQFTFSQDYDYFTVSFVGYKDKKYKKRRDETITIYLEEDVKKLKEVIVKADNRKTEIVNYKSRGYYSRIIGAKQTYGVLLFPIDSTTNYKLHSVFLNLEKVPLKSKIRVAFYETTTRNFTGKSRDKKKTYTATEIIPEINREIGHIDHILTANNETHIIEIKVDSTLISIPKKGVFVAVETLAMYDANDAEQALKHWSKFPILYFHTTRETNFCSLDSRVNPPEWQNSSKREQEFDKANSDHYIFPSFHDPSIGLKIMENRVIPEETK